MILAAGRGERMRPLTDTLPKALMLINNKPLIYYHIEKLAKLTINNIIINTSYLGSVIQDQVGDGKKFGTRILYSHEPSLLDVGGGIFNALPLLGPDPFLIISADIYTDYDFNCLLNPTHTRNYLGHLILVPNPVFHPEGDFGLNNLDIIPKTHHNQNYTYGSLGILHPDLFKDHDPSIMRFPIKPILDHAIEHKQLSGELYTGPWHNVGTMDDLMTLNHYL